jgi:hypothetical protein
MTQAQSVQTNASGDIVNELQRVMREAVSSPGQPVSIPSQLAGQLISHSSVGVLEIRKRERALPADLLALHLG